MGKHQEEKGGCRAHIAGAVAAFRDKGKYSIRFHTI